eukprot:gnl/Carplike_NY0171/3008_a4043_488.p1 GENE.gnl/Carplike_NY0171/3008_a4043_488~~gnl/Carplike_NY0171/3008_a4043_488.p1  ORF type:complete len:383 (-),score=108.06 gnl/Carplike_NY0171/3008_a4043_488:70-1218(-)
MSSELMSPLPSSPHDHCEDHDVRQAKEATFVETVDEKEESDDEAAFSALVTQVKKPDEKKGTSTDISSTSPQKDTKAPKQVSKSALLEEEKVPSPSSKNATRRCKLWQYLCCCISPSFRDEEEEDDIVQVVPSPSIKVETKTNPIATIKPVHTMVPDAAVDDSKTQITKKAVSDDPNDPQLKDVTTDVTEEYRPALLPPLDPHNRGKKCLVLDLDETLVHSSFKPTGYEDFQIAVELDGKKRAIFVSKRPYVDEFMRRMSGLYEIVIFTASLSKYADPLLDKLDIHETISSRLYREACVQHDGMFVKDLGELGRDLSSIIIVDNSPISYSANVDNAIPISSWFDDKEDTALLRLAEYLDSIVEEEDVRIPLQKSFGLGDTLI